MSVAKTGGSLRGGGATLLGDKELTRKLDRLSKSGSKKAIVAGVKAGMTPIAKAMRAAIQSTNMPAGWSPDGFTAIKREAKRSIGYRFTRTYRTSIREAVVGVGVAKRMAMRAKAIGKAIEQREKRAEKGKAGGKGVGVSLANVHWFFLGTKKRSHDSGHPTGRIEAPFNHVTRMALATSAPASVAAARKKIKQVIDREARKKG
jgi:hypothetical protein